MRWFAFLVLGFAAPPSAHGGHEHGIGWTLDAPVVGPLLLAAGLYLIGFVRLLRRSGRGRDGLAGRA